VRLRGQSSRILLAVLLAIAASIATILAVPTRLDYYVLDQGDLGHYKLGEESSWILSTRELDNVECKGVLIVAAAPRRVDPKYLAPINRCVESGASLVLYGPPEFVVGYLEDLGIAAHYRGEVFNPLNTTRERVVVAYLEGGETAPLYIYSPYSISVEPTRGGVALEPYGYTGPLAFIDEVPNELYDVGEPLGALPVAYILRLGDGLIYVFTARGVFTNNLYDYNSKLLRELASSRKILVYQAWVQEELALYIKILLYTPRGISPYYMVATTLLSIMVAVYVVKQIRGG
jgi:hypothetical protein